MIIYIFTREETLGVVVKAEICPRGRGFELPLEAIFYTL